MVRICGAFVAAALLCLQGCGGDEQPSDGAGGEEIAAGPLQAAAVSASTGDSSAAQAFFLMIVVGPGQAPAGSTPTILTRSASDAQSSPDPIPARPLGGDGAFSCGTERQDRCDGGQPPKP